MTRILMTSAAIALGLAITSTQILAGPLDRLEDRIDRREDVVDRHERRSWRRLWASVET